MQPANTQCNSVCDFFYYKCNIAKHCHHNYCTNTHTERTVVHVIGVVGKGSPLTQRTANTRCKAMYCTARWRSRRLQTSPRTLLPTWSVTFTVVDLRPGGEMSHSLWGRGGANSHSIQSVWGIALSDGIEYIIYIYSTQATSALWTIGDFVTLLNALFSLGWGSGWWS